MSISNSIKLTIVNLVEEHDKLILKRAREKHEKQNRKLVEQGKPELPFEGLKSKDEFIVINLPPILSHIKKKTPICYQSHVKS